jgi:hypothetical protein
MSKNISNILNYKYYRSHFGSRMAVNSFNLYLLLLRLKNIENKYEVAYNLFQEETNKYWTLMDECIKFEIEKDVHTIHRYLYKPIRKRYDIFVNIVEKQKTSLLREYNKIKDRFIKAHNEYIFLKIEWVKSMSGIYSLDKIDPIILPSTIEFVPVFEIHSLEKELYLRKLSISRSIDPYSYNIDFCDICKNPRMCLFIENQWLCIDCINNTVRNNDVFYQSIESISEKYNIIYSKISCNKCNINLAKEVFIKNKLAHFLCNKCYIML